MRQNTPHMPPYPWQQALWTECLSLIRDQRLPPALILHGEQGFGLTAFARQFADAILCRGEQERPCGDCMSCRLGKTRDNPDFLLIQPEKEEGALKIAQVRSLSEFVLVTTHYGKKVVLMLRAEQMTMEAANALLKTLEEPPEYATIILVCHFPSLLLPTIRSRCRMLQVLPPSDNEAISWLLQKSGRSQEDCVRHLTAAAGMPLVALEALDGKGKSDSLGREKFYADVRDFLAGRKGLTQVSQDWEKVPMSQVHRWLLEKVEDDIRGYFTVSSDKPIDLLFKLYERQKQRCHPRSGKLAPRLLLEEALYETEFVMARPRSH